MCEGSVCEASLRCLGKSVMPHVATVSYYGGPACLRRGVTKYLNRPAGTLYGVPDHLQGTACSVRVMRQAPCR